MKINCAHDELVPISKLKPHPRNRNTHPPDQIERLAKIMEYQGWRTPIKVSTRSGFITAGHGRLAAAIKNKWTEVPVDYQDYETEEQEYADLTADNAIASWAELNFGGINLDIGELGPFDIGFLGLKDFTIDVADKINSINSADENAEWVDMPEFNKGDGYIKLTYFFGSEQARQDFVNEHNIDVKIKRNRENWFVYL